MDVGDVAMVTDTVKEGGVKPDKTEEDGEISSGSSTPGPVSESQTAIPPRCYMDQEQGPTLERGGRDQRDNMYVSVQYCQSCKERACVNGRSLDNFSTYYFCVVLHLN